MNPKVKVIFSGIRKYAPTILTGMAVAGVGLTGLLSYRAAKKADPEKTFKEQWKNYIPVGVAGVGTIACVVGANWIHLSREAAALAAVAFYKAAGEDFQEAVHQKFGEEGSKGKVMEDWKRSPDRNMRIEIWEPYTHQWFEASQQEILWAELCANKMLQQKGHLSLNEVLRLYSDPSLKMKKLGDQIGWSWDDDMFCELSSYYYAGGWIDMCPQFVQTDGKWRFVMEYGINPNELPAEENKY